MGLLTNTGPLVSTESTVSSQPSAAKPTHNPPSSAAQHLTTKNSNHQATTSTNSTHQQLSSPNSSASSWSSSPENNNNNQQANGSSANQTNGNNSDINQTDNNFLYLNDPQQQQQQQQLDSSSQSQSHCISTKRQPVVPHQHNHNQQQHHNQQHLTSHSHLQHPHQENLRQHHVQNQAQEHHYQRTTSYFGYCQACGHQSLSCKCKEATCKMILDDTNTAEQATGSLRLQQDSYAQQSHQTSPPSSSSCGGTVLTRFEQEEYRLGGLDTNQLSNNYNQNLSIQTQFLSPDYNQMQSASHHLQSEKQKQQQQQQKPQQRQQNQNQQQFQHHHQNHHHHHQHQQQRQQLHQQVSSQPDHQLVISGSSNGDMLTADNQLAYSYDEPDDMCTDNWNMVLESQPDNCSSQANHSGAIFGDTSYQTSGLSVNEDSMFNANHREMPEHQGYRQQSNLHRISPKSASDLNNNQQQQQQQQDQQSSSLTPMQSGRPLEQSRDTFCNQQQDQQYFYGNSAYSGNSTNYHNQNNQAEYRYTESYDQNRAPYGQAVFTYELLDQNHSQAQSPNTRLFPLPTQPDHHQHSPTSSSINGQLNGMSGYEQHVQLVHHQQGGAHEQRVDQMKLRQDISASQYHDYSQTELQPPTYPVTQPHHVEQEVYSRNHTNQVFEHHNDPTAVDLYAIKSNYNDQQTLSRDNLVNQVSTTTDQTVASNDGLNKIRTLKGRRGRPRKKGLRSKNKVNGKLWEFIRDLLLSDRTNPSFIRWERREDGVFKFVQSDKVAKMWGERKQNPKMTYEKLSRAMRYYYKSKVLLPVFGRRLVYKFGPNATGWLPGTGDTLFS